MDQLTLHPRYLQWDQQRRAAELDARIAAYRLDQRVAAYRRQQVEQRTRQAYWSALDVHEAYKVRRRWRPLVLAGGASCSSCGRPIRPEDRWIVEPGGGGPEHASCHLDRI